MRRNIGANFYEGGKYTKANADFYNATADFESVASPDRDTLRARARWTHENNPIVANIDRTISANVIGGGIKFQFKLDEVLGQSAEKINQAIENAWEIAKTDLDVTGRDHFDELCKIVLQNRFMDGENLIYILTYKDGTNYRLGLQMIEVDRLSLGNIELSSGGYFYDGVETNAYGRPIAYHLSNEYFKQAQIMGKRSRKVSSDIRLSAKDVLHYYKRENRATQYRGVSEYKQIILDLKNFGAQMRATVEAARSRANIAYTVTRPQTPTQVPNMYGGKEIDEINGIFVQYLNAGESIGILDPKIADDNFDSFVRAVVRLIATGRSVSYELAFRDYAQVNYSSGRMSWLQDYKLFDEEFLHFSRNFYKPIFMRWLELECLKGSFESLGLSWSKFNELRGVINTRAIRLYPPKREWVDPLKESKAIETELRCNSTTLEAVYAKRGLDWKEETAQIAKENEWLTSLGLSRFNDANVQNTDDKELKDDEK